MPLQTLNLDASLQKKLAARLKRLVKNKLIVFPGRDTITCKPGFCMWIQLARNAEISSLNFGSPEGIRLFVEAEQKIIASVDFLYTGNRLKLSHIYRGGGLYALLNVMNKLEKKYINHKAVFHAQLISFLLSPGIHILLRSQKEKYFYTATPQKLTRTSTTQLEKLLKKIIDQKNKSPHSASK